MASSLILKETRPRKEFTNITQSGLKALNLALTYKAEIELRLPGITASLADDLDNVGVVVPGAILARHTAVAATSAQNALVEQGYARVRAVRETVRMSGASEAVQRAYGVGRRIDADRVRDVKAALQLIVERANDMPEEAAEFGLIAEDVAAFSAFITTLKDADMAQEKKRADAPLSTKERNKTGRRILQSVVRIAGAGRIAFANDPQVYASFAALVARSKRASASKGKKGAAAAKEEKGAEALKEESAQPSEGWGLEASKDKVAEVSKDKVASASKDKGREASKNKVGEASNDEVTEASNDESAEAPKSASQAPTAASSAAVEASAT